MNNLGNLEKAIEQAKNDKNNAVAFVYENQKLNKNGSLANAVYSLKNNYATADAVTHGSSKILENFIPYYDATVVNLLNNAGAVCAFKTNLDEFGLGGTGEYSAYGLVKNPLNKEYLVGGSSSGSAATLTENISFAIGSDTGDSVRVPASFVGKVGFKPSYGAVSRFGLFAFASSLDTVGWLTHDVYDSFKIANVLFQPDFKNDNSSQDLRFESKNIKPVKPRKVAYLQVSEYLDNEVKEEYQKTIAKLKAENIEMVEIKIDEDLLNSINVVYQIIAFTEASSNLANLTGVHFGEQIEGKDWEDTFIKTRQHGFGPMVQRRLILGSYYLEKENQQKYLLKAQKMRHYISDYFTSIHKNHDVFIYPASKSSAPKFNTQSTECFFDFILTNSNLTGNPSMTLPMGICNNNMPFSLAIDAEKFNDVKMLQNALYLEQILKEK
ncbi:amidase family protein [Mycoplasma phocoenae]|uniref:Asp-tRNA(Asn)/Glu-tRNA(Gln) amidotransferase subunit GatA n=1 Tax=Mycoplasma phocoenae TaxID=754517 RepID=A0A858U3E2_9MOLU|nr:amidase family protein [Mycoplasma phocoenae]QJG66990.1 Asp-tRNA(Asn)/Glu-tRNA(Gln) amidotransferase subunit GatA [Mycoplasma phocoenae]